MSRFVDVESKTNELKEEYKRVREEAEKYKANGERYKYRSLVAKANDIKKHIKWLEELPTVEEEREI